MIVKDIPTPLGSSKRVKLLAKSASNAFDPSPFLPSCPNFGSILFASLLLPSPEESKSRPGQACSSGGGRPTDRPGFVAAAAGHENSDPQSAFLHAAAKMHFQPRLLRPSVRPSVVCALHDGIAAGHVSLSLFLSLALTRPVVSPLAFKVLNTLADSAEDDGENLVPWFGAQSWRRLL